MVNIPIFSHQNPLYKIPQDSPKISGLSCAPKKVAWTAAADTSLRPEDVENFFWWGPWVCNDVFS